MICSVALALKALGLTARILATDVSLEALAATQTTLRNHGVREICLCGSIALVLAMITEVNEYT